MARPTDSSGVLLGGFQGPPDLMMTREAAMAPATTRTRLNPRFGAEETVPGLACSYGSYAYACALPAHVHGVISGHSRILACHNPVETPAERRHCDFCGGDYCTAHAARATHDCDNVILPA